ncbi:hypothetical protein ACROYT_G040890 [Oculina patagonica]
MVNYDNIIRTPQGPTSLEIKDGQDFSKIDVTRGLKNKQPPKLTLQNCFPVLRKAALKALKADILSPLTGKSEYAVTNSTHFVNTINRERIQEKEIMVSFDVESLFTNVPIEDAAKAALRKLENDPGLADLTNLTPTQTADLLNFV